MIIAKFARYIEMMPTKGLPWTEEASARIQKIPPLVWEMAKQAIEEEAKRQKEKVVTPEMVEHILAELPRVPFRQAIRAEEAPKAEGPLQGNTMPWTVEAEERLRRIPIPFVRRMLIQRVEEYAKDLGLDVVDLEAYEAGLDWQGR
jgi:hypothetical protein